ncbi:MAG: HAMP domain-containing histidine kinase [Gracilimonas sp.]|uniref:sensor histidine kinase n=1 Tax=Gracilimonas TaxID=649462 RepID=UPI001B0E4CAD|nr:HAMP domain-containing sensor histidine kinase [Gracilimonas sp.]MBO6585418.1 HAMP domain-containing histidine kinase [Gracilimonas sp.]MBO6616414.1 HAMP domain-containing histidine kinase [Gracilimonas sp.]
MKILQNRAFRWILLMLGLSAIIALTGMNVLSLYDLRDRMVESEEERRIDQLDEINDTIRNQILEPLRGLSRIELEPIENSLQQTGQLPDNFQDVLARSSKSPFFNSIYFTPENVDPCNPDNSIYRFDPENQQITPTNDYPDFVCDGVGLARTKTKIQLNDFNYRWNNNFEFDTHRSLNIGLINLSESRMIGYITLTLNEDYIVNEVLPPILTNYFGKSEETGIVVWVRDWTNNKVLATNDTTIQYDRDLRDHVMGFSGSGFFDNWSLNLAFLDAPVTNAYNETLIKNLIVLGVAVLFLLGALIFMFVTAQRERHLAQRQASFLANVTHELKTPLAVMQAAGENISDGRVTEPKRLKQYGEHIYNESIRLRSMIEKLLDVARVDSGQNMIKAAPYSIHNLMNKFLNENREYIENKGFEVKFKSSAEDAMCLIDSDSFETIVHNLTENAIKYSKDEKCIEYQISSNKDNVFFSISDHGMGIPKKEQKNIFKKFYRVDDSDSKSTKIKGHGLGLSIVRNMVSLNGGKIEVKSSSGKGTTFIVRFPKLDGDDVTKEQLQNVQTASSPTENLNKHTKYVG